MPSNKHPHHARPVDHGPQPYVVNIDQAAAQNPFYRAALWTGDYLQTTLMTIPVGGDIGLEMHPDTDQFLRIEAGHGVIKMGRNKTAFSTVSKVDSHSAIFVPAGTWHNLINTGNTPLRLYSIYAPPHHPFGTVHPTKRDAMEAERRH